MAKPPNSPKGFIMVMSVSAFFLQYYSMIYRTKNGMTEICICQVKVDTKKP